MLAIETYILIKDQFKITSILLKKLTKDKRIQDAATPALLHPDVISEDPTVVTAMLDWQSASIEPAFIYANEIPDFAALLEESEGPTFENGQDEHKDPARRNVTGSDLVSSLEETLKKHAQDYEDFETVQNLKQWLRISLRTDSDGWVPNDVWNAAKDAHRAAYDVWTQTARESESSGEGLQ
ncbi:LOW QUALITY PROTEIN: hypothetical protein IFM46972_07099 [Aspergillus udagawae]|uniref:Uncharacterized protein n=1 Tax=Aspergillus udagawae TaxID=91492 RepID=A0A8H3P7M5_9EURO|nr:LOW QUALITY PROTEIN: hypothetical protein IFM46972_07099 [Aspergillus udagawae]